MENFACGSMGIGRMITVVGAEVMVLVKVNVIGDCNFQQFP